MSATDCHRLTREVALLRMLRWEGTVPSKGRWVRVGGGGGEVKKDIKVEGRSWGYGESWERGGGMEVVILLTLPLLSCLSMSNIVDAITDSTILQDKVAS